MASSFYPMTRQPKGDHNRRLSLGLDAAHFAVEAGITLETLKDYENTGPGHRFDARGADRIGATLDRLEAILPNSQTGRRQAAAGVVIERIGLVMRLPIVGSLEADNEHPVYAPGGDI